MNIFLNLDGTAQKVTPERVFQGSNNVTAIDVFAPFAETTALEIAFTLPDGSFTAYKPMNYVYNGTTSVVVGVWEYMLSSSITAESGDVLVSINAVTTKGNQTSYQCRFTVEQSVIPALPPEPEADAYDLILQYLQQNSYAIVSLNAEQEVQDERIAQLENVTIRKVLTDFTVDATTGIGTKYYSDNTTATVKFPTSSSPTTVNHFVTVIDFEENSFVDGELAFSPMQTGQNSNNYIAALDKTAALSYEAGTEVVPSLHNGVLQTANTVFKGSDGSVLLSGFSVPFSGQLVIVGGGVLAGGVFVTSITFDKNTYILTVNYITGERDDIQLIEPIDVTRYSRSYLESEWSGATAPYSISIAASVHGKGTNPVIYTPTNTFGTTIASNGDITLTAAVKKAFKIIII